MARAQRLGDHKIVPGMFSAAVQRLRQAQLGLPALGTPPPAWKGMPTTGTVNVLAVPICFKDYPASATQDTTQAQFQARLFGAGDAPADPEPYPYESLHDYYQRSSYGQLDIQGDVLPWYNTGLNRSAVAQTPNAREALIQAAILSYANANPGWDPSKYDNYHDGTIDYVVVIWTGPHNGWSGFWWGYQTSFGGDQTAFQEKIGERLGTYSWQWESQYQGPPPTDRQYDPLVTIHETGHALGLPDYYDYQTGVGPEGGLGGLDMMDYNRGDHNVFSKWLLDWLTPQVVSNGYGPITLGASGTQPDALVVMPGVQGGDPFQQYFMVENRERVANDDTSLVADSSERVPADGLLIWHVDARLDAAGNDYLFDNSYTPHKLLRLMEADGLEEIGKDAYGLGVADAGDFYEAGDVFSATSKPASFAYASTTRAVVVRDISAPGPSMSLFASTDWAPPVTTVGGAATGWRRTAVSLAFTATDDSGLAAATSYRLDSGAWTPGAALDLAAPGDHSGDGVHAVAYRAVDMAGNLEATHKLTVRIDTAGPVCRAPRSAAVRRGRRVTLYYSVGDKLSPNADVIIRVRRAGGTKVVKVMGASGVGTGARHGLSFICHLPRGRYTFTVTAHDLAGNAPVTSGVNRLTVS
jgi:M6 family metalloprotease-like protein